MKHSLLTSILVLLAGCSTSVHSEGGKHSIQCMDAVSACHEQARSICPAGYLVTNRVRPRKMDGDIQYTLNIKCRQTPGF